MTAAAENRPLNLRKRADLVVHRQSFQGEAHWSVKDPLSLRYFHLREEEYFVFERLEAGATLHSIQNDFEREFAPKRIETRQLQSFLAMLHQERLVIANSPGQSNELLRTKMFRRRMKYFERLAGILAIQFRGIDPDRFLTWFAPKCGWMYSKVCVAFFLLLMLAAATLCAVQFQSFIAKLPEFREFISFQNAILLACTLACTKVLHEFAHAVTCKRYGGECHEMGIMLLAFTPCLFCNVTDAWMLRNKWHRIAISAAGMWVELTLASVCVFIWWFTVPGLLNIMCLNLIVVCSVTTLMFNGNPLLRYDGYYILSDYLEIPNLRQRASALLMSDIGTSLFGRSAPPDRLMPDRQRWFLRSFAMASYVYRWVVVLTILWFVHQAFHANRLAIVAQFITFIVLATMLLIPCWQLFTMLTNPVRSHDVSWTRFLLRGGAIIAVTSLLLLIPLPHRLKVPAVLEPKDAQRVYVTLSGQLISSVEAGQKVKKGETLAVLRNIEKEQEVAELDGQVKQQVTRLDSLEKRSFSDSNVEILIPSARKRLAELKQQHAQQEAELQRLEIVAPTSGTVLEPTRVQQTNADDSLEQWQDSPLLKRNTNCYLTEGTELCLIGSPEKHEALLAIDQSQVEFVRPGQTVWLLMDAASSQAIEGKIVELSEMDIDDVSVALLMHSDLETIQSEDGKIKPLSTTYQARVEFESAASLRTGGSGRAKILAEPLSLGKRLHRYLSRTFRFEL
ncbi:MAG: hypothetical protein CMJ78_06630 [Planctomycetaceae bacterium]|nr:hypothetical protein [Planctomycetaceae bacterium]